MAVGDIATPRMLFPCCLHEEKTCSSKEECERESGSDMEDKYTENKKKKKRCSRTSGGLFFHREVLEK